MNFVMKWLYKWASTPSKPRINSRAYLLYNGKYWNGSRFALGRDKAQRFPDCFEAWEFADRNLDDRYDPENIEVEEVWPKHYSVRSWRTTTMRKKARG